MMEERIQRAVELFRKGYNCSQAVCAAFADMYGYTEEQALRMSASFGGGIGKMRMTCGAACGMFMVAGLATGSTDGADKEGKEANYRLVQRLGREFARRNGSLVCAELLGLNRKKVEETVSDPAVRTVLKKRPCVKTVEEAARIWVEYLEGRLPEEESAS